MGTSQVKGSNYAWAVAIACVAFYAVPLGFAANHAGLFITPVMDQFGWSRTDATLFMSIQPWVAAICTPFAGKLISKYNPRWVLGTAVLVFALANLACAWFTEPWQWNVYGVLYGASAAFWMYIATPTMVNRWFSKSNGTVIGAIGVFVSLFGAIMSPIINGWIASMGWQTARIICSVIVIIAGAGVTYALLRESPEKMGVKPWGYDAAQADRAKSAEANVTEVKETAGLTRNQAMKNPALWLLILMAGMFVISASFVQQLASYASVTDGLGAAVGAMAVSVAMVTSMIGKFGLGWISDHFGAVASGIVAGVLGAGGALVCLLVGPNPTLFYVGVGMFGIGYSALNVVPPLTCQQAFGDKDYANIFSIVATGLNVFSGFAALIYAQIFDITGSFAGAFWMNIIFYVVICVLALVIVPMGRRAWANK
ncbi:MFS transporter [Adlercreutzia mucosicola]|uniref:MFS transporter n=1 Tax=Adlercreutzia mucosicola TaxID=580026 RepID=A0A6N8JM13_9ACTN|nr:MFS transporter [Adlercreutzia mucosicola]MCI9495007.1 MFS transporter [Adlercreutzia mucosicola]MCR2036132.1 MFS transporter [Adlercreutzia mucosicola]MVX60921.1 MFS transporter [Adlercreutzia mucosicola]